jgi:hypothetical protein
MLTTMINGKQVDIEIRSVHENLCDIYYQGEKINIGPPMINYEAATYATGFLRAQEWQYLKSISN